MKHNLKITLIMVALFLAAQFIGLAIIDHYLVGDLPFGIDKPEINEDYIYEYRDGSNFKLKGSPRNTAGWNSVEVTGHIIEKIGPILATKYSEIN